MTSGPKRHLMNEALSAFSIAATIFAALIPRYFFDQNLAQQQLYITISTCIIISLLPIIFKIEIEFRYMAAHIASSVFILYLAGPLQHGIHIKNMMALNAVPAESKLGFCIYFASIGLTCHSIGLLLGAIWRKAKQMNV